MITNTMNVLTKGAGLKQEVFIKLSIQKNKSKSSRIASICGDTLMMVAGASRWGVCKSLRTHPLTVKIPEGSQAGYL